MRSNLTVNLGLRYERLYGAMNEDLDTSIFPITIPYIDVSKRGDTNNFGPRTGFAWDVTGNGGTVVRGGYGLYYGHVRTLGNLTELRNYQQFSITISNPPYPDPYNGRDPPSFIVSAPTNITVVANDYVQPYSNQFNLGFSRRLTADFALHIDGVVTNLDHDRKTLDINPRDPTTLVRPNTAFGRVDQNQSTAWVDYRAVYTKLEKRFSHRTQALVTYTFTRSRDNNPGSRYLDPFRLDLDEGTSNGERRHAVVASGSVLLPWRGDARGGVDLPQRSSVDADRRARPERRRLQYRPRAWRATERRQPESRLECDQRVARPRMAGSRSPRANCRAHGSTCSTCASARASRSAAG